MLGASNVNRSQSNNTKLHVARCINLWTIGFKNPTIVPVASVPDTKIAIA